jgi:hypothetical protein
MSGGVSVYYCMGTWGPKYLGICLCYGDLGTREHGNTGEGGKEGPGKRKGKKIIYLPTPI